jgi:hypothetical protein
MIKIVKEDNFEKVKKHWLDMCDASPDCKHAYDSISYNEGTRLILDIEVTDRYLSQSIIGLLNHKTSKIVENPLDLGFTVNCIRVSHLNEDEIIGKLFNLIHEIRNDK